MSTKREWIILIGVVLIILITAGCGGEASPTIELPVPTVTQGEPSAPPTEIPPTEIEPTDTPTEEPTAVPTEEPDPTPTEEPTEAADACIDCHTDKQALIDTAKPEDEVVSENEGEG